MKKTHTKRMLSLLLALVFCMAFASTQVFAQTSQSNAPQFDVQDYFDDYLDQLKEEYPDAEFIDIDSWRARSVIAYIAQSTYVDSSTKRSVENKLFYMSNDFGYLDYAETWALFVDVYGVGRETTKKTLTPFGPGIAVTENFNCDPYLDEIVAATGYWYVIESGETKILHDLAGQ